MKNLLEIMLNGAYDNFKRIFFASDRVTDIEMRNAILNGEVKPEEKVNEDACIGCGGCDWMCLCSGVYGLFRNQECQIFKSICRRSRSCF